MTLNGESRRGGQPVVNPSILVVEDEYIIAYELMTAVEEMGFSVCGIVGSGEEAVDLAERHRPGVVLVDVRLRGEMDGVEAAHQIRNRFGIRSALLSGCPAEEIMTRADGARPLACFSKPLEYSQIEALLR